MPSPLGRVPPEGAGEVSCGFAALFRHGFNLPPGGELPQRGKRVHPGVLPEGEARGDFNYKKVYFLKNQNIPC